MHTMYKKRTAKNTHSMHTIASSYHSYSLIFKRQLLNGPILRNNTHPLFSEVQRLFQNTTFKMSFLIISVIDVFDVVDVPCTRPLNCSFFVVSHWPGAFHRRCSVAPRYTFSSCTLSVKVVLTTNLLNTRNQCRGWKGCSCYKYIYCVDVLNCLGLILGDSDAQHNIGWCIEYPSRQQYPETDKRNRGGQPLWRKSTTQRRTSGIGLTITNTFSQHCIMH